MIIALLPWVYMVEHRGMISGESPDSLFQLICIVIKLIDLAKSYIEHKINEND